MILPYRTVSCRHGNVNSIRREVKALSARHHPHPHRGQQLELQPRIGSLRPFLFFATQEFWLCIFPVIEHLDHLDHCYRRCRLPASSWIWALVFSLPRQNLDALLIVQRVWTGVGLRFVTPSVPQYPIIRAGFQIVSSGTAPNSSPGQGPGVLSRHLVPRPRGLFRYNIVPVTDNASPAPLRACLCQSQPHSPSVPVPIHPRV